ncbi:aromatic peroxygenase precursor [Ephemerocybe angulata]|uniref:Aromatic peroxygenase n=1 Tax=Ephemerocybe angulata TaxID=980116 RepID=A0A8H6HE88_9AGAR|nr:aromatic peroxygenase precursor [Tulosesus angulatus]
MPPLPVSDLKTTFGGKPVQKPAYPPLERDDIRGPCPGLNTLASHGYLPSNGVASPSQIINAVQEAFNMESGTARFVTYAAHLVDGNLVTDLLSIGGKTSKTGPNPPAPASVGGLNTHAVFEGDSSMTRADFFFGDNHSLNETLFKQFIDFSNRFGGGFYNLTVAQELRHQRVQESIATNPTFNFTAPRFFTAFAESSFPIEFFVDGRNPVRGLSIANATLFFKESKFPVDFFRAAAPTGGSLALDIFSAYPIAAGRNVNGINTYTPDPTSADFDKQCLLYSNFVTKTVVLRRNLIINLGFFFDAIENSGCTELFPYGKL